MKKNKLIILLIITFLIPGKFINAQIGGSHTYEFLNLTNSSRIAAMGGNFLTIKDHDLSLALSNPSLITDKMHNNFALNFVDYYADINYGFATYSRTFKKFGSFITGVQYVNYGTFTRADETGQTYDDFKVSENAFYIGWSRQLDSNFSIGSNLKVIYSALDSYYSYGIAVDVAGSYHSSRKNFTASFIARNIGTQITSYVPGNPEPLPFEMQLGISKRLKHVPLRYSILYRHIEKFDLTYSDPNEPEQEFDPLTGELIPEKKLEKFADKVMRHLIIGAEFAPVKNFYIRMGYNYQRRQELKVASKVSTVGFSWGFGLRISKFHFSYARAAYHLAGSPNIITITTDLSDFRRKKQG
ncbi:type IX secretion system protein PorQ [Bacteroidota bacterium]